MKKSLEKIFQLFPDFFLLFLFCFCLFLLMCVCMCVCVCDLNILVVLLYVTFRKCLCSFVNSVSMITGVSYERDKCN